MQFQASKLVFPFHQEPKLFIHGVASCTDFKIPAFSILSISGLKLSLRWTGNGWQGVSLGGILGSNWMPIWYTKKLANSFKHVLDSVSESCSLFVISLLPSCCLTIVFTGLWAVTSCICFEQPLSAWMYELIFELTWFSLHGLQSL